MPEGGGVEISYNSDAEYGFWLGLMQDVGLYVSDVGYTAEHTNIDYMYVWFAESVNNHCECAECQKKSPSDYYLLLMNELDRMLTEKEVATSNNKRVGVVGLSLAYIVFTHRRSQ